MLSFIKCRHHYIPFFEIVIVTLLSFSNCLGQWTQCNGPYGGSITCFAESGANLFVGTRNGGVFVSTNNGSDWLERTTGLKDLNINCLIIKDTYIFAGTNDSGLFRSSNNGFNWEKMNIGTIYEPLSIYSMELKGVYLFASRNEGVFRSSDNGVNWIRISSGLNNEGYFPCMKVYGKEIFVSDYSYGLYHSTNDGNNWILLTNQVRAVSLQKFGNNLLAATFQGGLFKSTDNGVTWGETVNNLPSGAKVSNIFVNSSYIFVGTETQGIFRTTALESPINFTVLNNGLSYLSVPFIYGNSSYIFAGTDAGGIFKSSNNGITWAESNVGLTANNISSITSNGSDFFSSVSSIRGISNQTINGGGIYKSTNLGLSWHHYNDGLQSYNVNCLAKISNNIIAGTFNKIYFLQNGLSVWQQSNLSPGSFHFIVKGNNVFGNYASSILKSTDNGISWNGIASIGSNCMANNINSIFIGVTSYPQTIYRSTNDGLNWSEIINGLQTDIHTFYTSIACNGNNIFVGTEYHNTNDSGITGKIFYSSNNGDSWIPVSNGLPNKPIRCIQANGENIFAGTDVGIYLSTNNGQVWLNRNQGFAYPPSINSLYISDNSIYAATKGKSIWRRSYSDILGIKNLSTQKPDGFTLLQNYPNPFNPKTKINFSLPFKTFVNLDVYDSEGKKVSSLVNEKLDVGSFQFEFDGEYLSSGIYFYILKTNEFKETKKMVLIK